MKSLQTACVGPVLMHSVHATGPWLGGGPECVHDRQMGPPSAASWLLGRMRGDYKGQLLCLQDSSLYHFGYHDPGWRPIMSSV